MKLGFLLRRRFEVLVGACFLGLAFVGIVWLLMAVLKAINPVVFHFNLLLDILPWFTPVLILLVLSGPLYWKVAGLVAGPGGSLQRLVDARYQLVAGAFFYLLTYTVVVWATMNLLRIWDVYDFHFNPLVDWLPAIVPPWFGWVIGGPLAWKTLGSLDIGSPGWRYSRPDPVQLAVTGVLGGTLLTGGGFLLNQGAYAVSQGLAPTVAQNLNAFGSVLLGGGSLAWAVMLWLLWRGWRRVEQLPELTNPLDRFRSARGRILCHGFVLTNLLFGFGALLMAAFQAMDPYDFHFYLAKDIWSLGLPLFFGWLIFALGSVLVPARLANLDPAHFEEGAGASGGPTGIPSGDRDWGYSERDLRGTGLGV